ncbi:MULTISPECIES: TIGR03943 family putative permease subunit [unclassified Agromyces]|uniref:TIGR03943 family putative permease subunit n=1 Tax=unclassified Agromyces TaxID=2639701 RepID=UPI0030147E38
MREFLRRWQGVILAAIGVVATLWLAATNRLGFYIHPRYFLFTVVMAVIAVVFVVGAFAVVPLLRRRATDAAGPEADGDEMDHDHDHDHDHGADAAEAGPAASARRRLGTAAGVAIVAGTAVALLVLPPATLTTATAENRELNAAAVGPDSAAPDLVGGDTSSFTVKDWALLLRQNPDPADFVDPVEVTGFVLPSPDDPDVFYVARFTVTCCAVDAQPVGVPVHLPGWQDRFSADDWVAAEGRLGDDPAGGPSPVLIPESLEPTEQPEQPYVF